MHRTSHPLAVALRAVRRQLSRSQGRPSRRRVQASRHRLTSPRSRVGAARRTTRLATGLVTSVIGRIRRLWHGPSRPRHLAAAAPGHHLTTGAVLAGLMIVGLAAGAVALASPSRHRAPSAGRVDAQLRAPGASHASRSGRANVAPVQPPKGAAAPAKPRPWVSPMPGVRLSSCFGPRWGTLHQGIDFAGDFGTTIRAVGAGTVLGAGWLYSGYGISVVIDHGNGFFSHYAHMSAVLVRPGQKVRPGQPIGREGSTGDSTGPHLHFEIHHGMWNQINPAPWLRAHGVHTSC
jgi:murein DD-endopeptidase MepM/ murein hydrolase activator NlpD